MVQQPDRKRSCGDEAAAGVSPKLPLTPNGKATLSGLETIRTIKRGHIHDKQPGVLGEIAFISGLFRAAA